MFTSIINHFTLNLY